MKTSIFSILLLGFGTAIASAQGSISVGNGIAATRFPIYGPEPDGNSVYGNGPLSAPTGSTVFTGGLLSGTRYVIEFWAGPASAIDFSGLTLITSTTFRTSIAAGDVLPKGITTTILATIPGVPADAQAKLAVRVWDSQGATSYHNATYRGQGALFLSAPLGGGLTTPPNWVGQSFSLFGPPIPEPSSLALGGLGAASLLIFRRRK